MLDEKFARWRERESFTTFTPPDEFIIIFVEFLFWVRRENEACRHRFRIRADHPHSAPGRSGRRFCIVCSVHTHTLTPPIQLSVNQVILTRLMYKCSGFKKIFSLLLLLLYLFHHPLLLLFRGPCEFLRFFLVSTASGHTPKRERRGNWGSGYNSKMQRIYLAVAGAGPDQSSVRPSGRNRERKRRQNKSSPPTRKI